MRKYSSITPKFWIGKTGRKLRADISAKLVAAYLLSCPTNDMTGVFYCPLCQISAETGLPLEAPSVPLTSPFQGTLKGIREALETLQREDFAIYDYETEYVFVKKMALFQIAPELKPTDKRVTGIRTAIESMPENFKYLFIKEYNECFNLGFKDLPEHEVGRFCSQTQEEIKLSASSIEAPSKALRSQEQEQEQEQEIYTRTEKSEKQPEQVDSFAGRVSENLSSFSQPEPLEIVGPVEEELPLVEKAEVVETAPLSSKPKAEEKPHSRGKATNTQATVAKPDDVSADLWADFLAHKKHKKAPVTNRVIALIRNEAKKAGWTLEEALNEVILRNWVGFKAEWVEAKDPNAVWVKAEDYQPELPPVEFAPSAQEKFDQIMARSSYAYNVSDLSMFEKAMKKKQLEQKKREEK